MTDDLRARAEALSASILKNPDLFSGWADDACALLGDLLAALPAEQPDPFVTVGNAIGAELHRRSQPAPLTVGEALDGAVPPDLAALLAAHLVAYDAHRALVDQWIALDGMAGVDLRNRERAASARHHAIIREIVAWSRAHADPADPALRGPL